LSENAPDASVRRMKHIITVSLLSFAGLTAVSSRAQATVLFADCGAGGDVSIVQNKLGAMARGDTLVASGSCAGGALNIVGLDSITISNLKLQDPINITVRGATHISFNGLSVNGVNSGLYISDHSSVNASNTTLNGWLQVGGNSSGTFYTLTVAGSGANDGVACLGSSDCYFESTTITGAYSSDPTLSSIGLQVASAARLNFRSGTIRGFDWGVHVWDNAIAWIDAACADTLIDSNRLFGVYVRDGGVAKISADSTCSSNLNISNNGTYGLLAEGGGQATLLDIGISGSGVDSIRAQDGANVKVRSSRIGAALRTGRSAWIKSQSHLWFNEESAGPGASSTLAGPVCVTNGSTVDTDNSSTVLTTTDNCGTTQGPVLITRPNSPL
jgi:hypothetical protein